MATDAGSNNSKLRKRNDARSGRFAIFLLSALVALLLIAFGSLQYYLPFNSLYCPRLNYAYNSSTLASAKPLTDGSVEYRLIVVTDLDNYSKLSDKNKWQSFLRQGKLTMDKNFGSGKIEWEEETRSLQSQFAAGGRAMELSDLADFDGNILTVDDRTGIIYKIVDNKDVVPWIFLNDGPGNTTKGFKGEWMTIKDERLYVGGLGKEWTTPEGVFVNYNPMYVKAVSALGEVEHLNWVENYKALRRAAGIEYPGYMIFESAQWSDIHKQWFFLPRRASKATYSETQDEFQGTNLLLIADEHFSKVDVREVGDKGDGSRGFSAFQFLPDSGDSVIVALKSQERDGVAVASFITVFNVHTGRILLEEQALNGEPYKFEGILFV